MSLLLPGRSSFFTPDVYCVAHLRITIAVWLYRRSALQLRSREARRILFKTSSSSPPSSRGESNSPSNKLPHPSCTRYHLPGSNSLPPTTVSHNPPTSCLQTSHTHTSTSLQPQPQPQPQHLAHTSLFSPRLYKSTSYIKILRTMVHLTTLITINHVNSS